jgi:hypothetical protein
MIRFLLCVLFSFCVLSSRAQWLSLLFNQSGTRQKEDDAQVTALQTFIDDARKGYNLVESGLHTIKELKSGEFNLHNAFYTSLESVNPVIGKMGEVVEILSLQVAIVERLHTALTRYQSSAVMGPGDLDAIDKISTTIIDAGMADLKTLATILSSDSLQMTDDQRMGKIIALDASMKERYGLTTGFTNQTDILNAQRVMEAADIETLKALYGLP